MEISLVPDGYIKRKTSTIPFGYTLDNNIQGYLKPNHEEIDLLKEISESVYASEISLGVGVDWLEYKTGKRMSRAGLKKHVDKVYGRKK
jgi:hypothetical protein|tara:strand:- start:340 stop:606 length:267 start_codon:yes stop_codon:yes gene_type:complete